MVLKIFKKKKVPEELPDLATDEIEKKLEKLRSTEKFEKIEMEIVKPEIKEDINKDEKIPQKNEEIIIDKEENPKNIEVKNSKESSVNDNIKKEILEEKPKLEIIKDEKKELNKTFVQNNTSFFKELENSLNKDIKNVNDLESWYNKRILSTDSVSEMKMYWEKQKSDKMLEFLGKNYHEKIAEKILILQVHEKEWQTIYFSLLEIEEKIREEEKVLKKLLLEFMEEYRKRKDSSEEINEKNKIIEFVNDDNENKIIKIR